MKALKSYKQNQTQITGRVVEKRKQCHLRLVDDAYIAEMRRAQMIDRGVLDRQSEDSTVIEIPAWINAPASSLDFTAFPRRERPQLVVGALAVNGVTTDMALSGENIASKPVKPVNNPVQFSIKRICKNVALAIAVAVTCFGVGAGLSMYDNAASQHNNLEYSVTQPSDFGIN